MHKGATRTGDPSSALFGTGTLSALVQGTGAAVATPQTAIDSVEVGLGNAINIYVYLNLLTNAVGNLTNIKWIDILTSYEWSARVSSRWPADDPTNDPLLSTTVPIYQMDTVPQRFGEYPGTNLLYRQYRAHRLPNPADPDNLPPADQYGNAPPSNEVIFIIKEDTAADLITVQWMPIAVDSNQTAILRAGESIQIGVMPGAFARMP